MKKIIHKQLFTTNNSLFFTSIIDLKKQITYISIEYNTKYKIIYIPKEIINFPLFFSIYLFSKKKNILNTIIKNIKNKILYFYFEYQLHIKFIGTGYKFFYNNKFLYFILGYSHLIKINLPNNCSIILDKNNKLLKLIYSNKYILGNIFYILKSCRKINIYKGKGIKNVFDQLKLKLGKTKNLKK